MKNAPLLTLFLLVFGMSVSTLQAQHFVGGPTRNIKLSRSLKPSPPNLAEEYIKGGRVEAIAVNPSDSNIALAVHQFGGIWRTTNNAATWEHCDGLSQVFVQDVVWGKSGKVFATVKKNLKRTNEGGVYLSLDGGNVWQHLVNSVPPSNLRISAYGIDVAPSRPDTIYVGTDFGVSVTYDGGRSWFYRVPGGVAGTNTINILAVTNDTVIAGTNRGAYISYDAGNNWQQIFRENFTYSINRLDKHPLNTHLVFMISDNGRLVCYNTRNSNIIDIRHPPLWGRWPYIRVSHQSADDPGFILWFASGGNFWKATSATLAGLSALTDTIPSWTMDRGVLHADMGDLAFDSTKTRPIFVGTDGGIFRSINANGLLWQGAANFGSGMNSLQISSLAGTEVRTSNPRRPRTYDLYFTTQDNDNHGSADNGVTWPFGTCTEGFGIMAPLIATNPAAIRTTHLNISCTAGPLIANRNFASYRVISTTHNSAIDSPVMNRWSLVTPISSTSYLRYCKLRSGNIGFFVSRTINADRWELIGTARNLEIASHLAALSRIGGNTVAYYASDSLFQPQAHCSATDEKIGLIRIDNVLATGVVSYAPGNKIRLPNGGSLGMVATEFDWHAVFGVHPEDGQFIIAPDVCNQQVMISRDGGAEFKPDTMLTRLVTEGGTRLLYEWPANIQITCITFDPYDNNHIIIGTKELGLIESIDRGRNWYFIDGSDRIKFVTGIFYEHDGNLFISSYGCGLWTTEFERTYFPEPKLLCLNANCLRFIDPRFGKELVLPINKPEAIKGYLVYHGKLLNTRKVINGATQLKLIKGSVVKFYNMNADEQKKYHIVYRSDNFLFAFIRRVFFNSKPSVGMVYEQNNLLGLFESKEQLQLENEFNTIEPTQNMLLANYDFTKEEQQVLYTKPEKMEPKPFIIISSREQTSKQNRIRGSSFTFSLYNHNPQISGLSFVKINGEVTKDIKGSITPMNNGTYLEGKFDIPALLMLQKETLHAIELHFDDGTVVTESFYYAF